MPTIQSAATQTTAENKKFSAESAPSTCLLRVPKHGSARKNDVETAIGREAGGVFAISEAAGMAYNF